MLEMQRATPRTGTSIGMIDRRWMIDIRPMIDNGFSRSAASRVTNRYRCVSNRH